MALACPQCAAALKTVAVPAAIGYFLEVDQCPSCGGIWCDRWEVFPLSGAAVDHLDPVDLTALGGPVRVAPRDLRCPRCHAKMRAFRDPALPEDARIERCLNCEGMWFNRGQLRRFKRHTLGATAPTANISNAELTRLTGAVLPGKQTPPTVRDLDAAMRPGIVGEPVGDLGEELFGAAVWMAARAALRLLFRI